MGDGGAKVVVVRSLESSDGGRCVDLFRRADDTFGFEEFRRDPEDPRGWGPAGAFGHRVFATENDALAAAVDSVGWLSGVPGVI